MMWIQHVPFEKAEGRLRAMYERIKGPDGHIDNIMLAHSLRPASMEGHMALYKNVLHHAANVTPKWFLEAVGVYVSRLNACDYCVAHHAAGLRRLVADGARCEALLQALEAGGLSAAFTPAEQAALRYAEVLTRTPHARDALKAHVDAMRSAGLDDGAILEINQVAAYFSYANRTVLGLGVTTEGDVLGLSPGDAQSPNDWSHR